MNIYNEPETFGLSQVASLDTAGSYEFDMVVVWKDKTGQHYLGGDSGCSCPSPFEDVSSLADLTRFDAHSLEEVENALKKADASYSDGQDFMKKVKDSLAGN